MSDHRFQIGERVVAAVAFGVATGLYEITRTLPLSGRVPQYRAKNLDDGYERAILEPSLRPVPSAANQKVPPRPSKPKAR